MRKIKQTGSLNPLPKDQAKRKREIGLCPSTYYENISRRCSISEKNKSEEYTAPENNGGRPVPGYSLTGKGEKIPDEQIKEFLCKLVCGDDFSYGYNKLTICIREDYDLKINRKKVYRLCKELNILKPQRKKRIFLSIVTYRCI